MANIVIFHWRDMKHPEKGGSTQNTVHVAEHLAAQGHNVTYLTQLCSKHKEFKEIVNGVKYIRIGNKITQYITLPLYFLQNLKKNTDLVIEAYDAWPFLTPLLHKKVIMLICHVQNEEWVMEWGKLLGPIFRWIAQILLRVFYKNSDVVGISESTLKSIIDLGIRPKSLTNIPVGIEDLIFTNEIPQKVTDKVICCTPGRLKSHKRVDMAIKVVADYNKNNHRGPCVYFDIIGAGDHEEYLKNLVNELNMRKYIKFHGRASDEIKAELLSRAHLHFQLSKREGWGLTAIEAGAQGAPTICFDILGLRDSVSEETGYIVKDEQELYLEFPKIIKSIITNSEEYKSKIKKAFEFAQNYRWSNIDSQWDQLIARVLRPPTQQG